MKILREMFPYNNVFSPIFDFAVSSCYIDRLNKIYYFKSRMFFFVFFQRLTGSDDLNEQYVKIMFNISCFISVHLKEVFKVEKRKKNVEKFWKNFLSGRVENRTFLL